MMPLELWGGVECTVNRVADRFFDQLRRNGHCSRLSDLDRFAAMGFRALRHPVLWERIAPNGLDRADWSFADASLARLRQLGVRPIATLLHHGSGPVDTNLLDPAFPAKLAAYARAVAERYPWVEDYTPVNEPLTTARFSGLYGHWYPHGHDDRQFIRALVNECTGVALAMREIRAVNPRARLIQTDDAGETFATPRLAYQARFENQRRWLGFDLLAGRVTPEHPLWNYLVGAGADLRAIDDLVEQPCLPDVVALNYYLTSDRVLDERLERYPDVTHGGNGRDRYADVEAVRAWPAGIVGHREILLRAWNRYGVPVALGEVHLGCTREEQLRWLVEAWEGCLSARAVGADVRALTVWSLLGAFDWNRLVTVEGHFYEPGVFDVRAPEPRETALGWAARELGAGRIPDHPVLDSPGFWQRPTRLVWGGAQQPEGSAANDDAQPLAVVGATGTLGQAIARACAARGVRVRLLSRREMDIAVRESVGAALEEMRPWAVVNAAGYVRVDDAESDRVRCERENTVGPRVLAEACAARGLPLVTFSSDLVFDGAQRKRPYVESDPVHPLNVYGETKALAEEQVLAAHPGALVVRTSAFFGPWDEYNFVTIALRELETRGSFHAAADAVVSPTYVPDLVEATLDLLLDRASGIWHVSGPDAVSWWELARRAARAAGIDERGVVATSFASDGLPARRPAYSALGSERGMRLPVLDDALARYLEATRGIGAALAANDGRRRVVCGGGDACPGYGRCGVHR
jgi:dTDP-4-dehydrorhamnose reductase